MLCEKYVVVFQKCAVTFKKYAVLFKKCVVIFKMYAVIFKKCTVIFKRCAVSLQGHRTCKTNYSPKKLKSDKILVYRFPKDETGKEKWIKAIPLLLCQMLI